MNSKKYFCILILLAGSISCQKGEDIIDPAYGKLNITTFFADNVPPLLVQVDGKTIDTLRPEHPSKLINLYAGDRNIQMVNQQTQQSVLDTILHIEPGATTNMPQLYYIGNTAVFDDMTSKPEKDSMLVRFIILDPSLPDELDLHFTLYDFGSFIQPIEEKKLYGVRKDRFSQFIQLPDPVSMMPDAPFLIFGVEAYKAGTNEKVMDLAQGTGTYVVASEWRFFVPNAIISVGIGRENLGAHEPFNIFTHIVE
jgi:hypothetical protein